MTEDEKYQEAKKLFANLNAAIKGLGKKLDAFNRKVEKLEKMQNELLGILDEGALPILEELLDEMQEFRKDAKRNPMGGISGFLKEFQED